MLGFKRNLYRLSSFRGVGLLVRNKSKRIFSIIDRVRDSQYLMKIRNIRRLTKRLLIVNTIQSGVEVSKAHFSTPKCLINIEISNYQNGALITNLLKTLIIFLVWTLAVLAVLQRLLYVR